MAKTIFCFLGTLALLVIGAEVELIIGAIIGGNYLTGLEFGDVRCYEAVGIVAAAIGIVVGALLRILLWVRLVKIP